MMNEGTISGAEQGHSPGAKPTSQGDGHHVTWRYMTAAELAEREAGQNAYDAMLARQEAFEHSREVAAKKPEAVRAGCVFAKSCKLPDAIIDYSNPSGMVPTDSLKDYGELILLGAREADASGGIPLKKISANTIPVGFGSLALAGSAFEVLPALASPAAAATLVGLVALLMPSSLGDSALYTDEQLSTLKQARTRVRLRVEQQADGDEGQGEPGRQGHRPEPVLGHRRAEDEGQERQHAGRDERDEADREGGDDGGVDPGAHRS